MPEIAFAPDQSPAAVQLFALLLSQLRVVEPLLGTVAGFAEKVTDIVDGTATDTVAESFAAALLPECR